jgi:hypothetical protein
MSLNKNGASMVSGIIGNNLYTQQDNKLYQFTVSWSQQVTVPTRLRRASVHTPEATAMLGDADAGTDVPTVAMWVVNSVAVVVLAVVAVTTVVKRMADNTEVEGFVANTDLFTEVGHVVSVDSVDTGIKNIDVHMASTYV